jgi:hypothetical protein
MNLEKLKWMWRLLNSKTYLVLTDKASIVNIPLTRIDSFKNRFLLSAQTSALQEVYSRLGDLIREHEQAVELLFKNDSEQDSKPKRTSNKSSGNKVRKSTKG